MTTNTPLRVTQIDLLEGVPAILGHTPHDSVVLVMTDQGGGGHVTLTVRIDLPSEISEVAQSVAGLHHQLSDKHVQWTGGTIVVWDEGVERKTLYAEVIKAMHQMVTEMGREVYGAFHVGAARINGVDRAGQVDVERDPSRGDRITLQAMTAGHAPLDSREAVAATVEGTGTAGHDLDRIEELVKNRATTRTAARPQWWNLIDNGLTENTDVTLLAASILADRDLRDSLIIYAGGGLPEALDLMTADLAEPTRKSLRNRPHAERLEVVEHVRQLVTQLDDKVAVPTLTVLASIAHEAHLSLLTIVALERVERIEPDYCLANLVRKLAENGIYTTDSDTWGNEASGETPTP